MNIEQMREIAEAAFKRQFGHINVVGINVRQGLDFEDDTPIVDVNIVYDDNDGQLEIHDKTWLAGKQGRPRLSLRQPHRQIRPWPARPGRSVMPQQPRLASPPP